MEIEMKKALKDYTLGEVKSYCKRITEEKGSHESCETCKFNVVCCVLVEEWELTEVKLTETEKIICRAAGAKYVSRYEDLCAERVLFWDKEPSFSKGTYDSSCGAECIGMFVATAFPSVQPGDCICVDGE